MSYISKQGYRTLTSCDHPLADGRGEVGEHRKILYDMIGPGPHDCTWCGKVLEGWSGGMGIHADHLDEDRLNNDPGNLVPSCKNCNGRRGRTPKVRHPRYVKGTPENRAFGVERTRRYRERKKAASARQEYSFPLGG